RAVLRSARALGCGDKICRVRRIVILTVRNTDNERRRRGSKRTNFQSWAAQTIEVLVNQSHAATSLYGCNEACGAVVLLGNLRGTLQRREKIGKPCVVFGIVGERQGDKTFSGDLLQPDLAHPGQWMRRMHGDTDGVT